MKVAIVEDNIEQLTHLKNVLTSFHMNIEIVSVAQNNFELESILSTGGFDLLISDIMLGNSDVFSSLNKIESIDFQLLFITGHNNFAIKAIKMQAIDYILKPVSALELKNAIHRAITSLEGKKKAVNIQSLYNTYINEKNKKISLPTIDGYDVIDIDEIVYIESDKNYSIFHFTERNSLIASKSIKDFEEDLTPFGFYRIHKSHIINISFLDKISRGLSPFITLKNGKTLTVARRRRDGLLKHIPR